MIITISAISIIRDCPWSSSWGSSLSRRVKIELNSCSEGGVFKEVEQCPSTLALLDTRLVDWTRKSNVNFLLWTVFSHVLTTRKITGYHDTRFCLKLYIYIITWYMIVGSLWHRDHVWLYNVIYNKCIYNDLLKDKAIYIYTYIYIYIYIYIYLYIEPTNCDPSLNQPLFFEFLLIKMALPIDDLKLVLVIYWLFVVE